MLLRMRVMLLLLAALSMAGALAGCAAVPGVPADETAAAPTGVPPGAEGTPTAAPPGGVEVALQAVQWPDGPVVARVNGVDIPTEAWRAEVVRQLQFVTAQYEIDWNDRESLARVPEFLDGQLDYMIDVELLRQAAAKENIAVTDEEAQAEVEKVQQEILAGGQYDSVEAFLEANQLSEETFQEMVREQMLVDRLVEAHGGPSAVEQVHARHILVADEQTAKEVQGKLGGGESFESLAQAYSDDESSKEQGGDLGWVPRGMMVPEFDEAAFGLAVGTTSEPVKSDFGYHIIRVEEREVRELEEPMLTQVRQIKFAEWLDGERSGARIERLYSASPITPP